MTEDTALANPSGLLRHVAEETVREKFAGAIAKKSRIGALQEPVAPMQRKLRMQCAAKGGVNTSATALLRF